MTNKKRQIDSDTYGSYTQTYVGTISIGHALKSKSIEEVSEWLDKYHPKNYFVAWGWGPNPINEHTFEVWVPIKEDNLDLPIGRTQKEVNIWIDKSQGYLI